MIDSNIRGMFFFFFLLFLKSKYLLAHAPTNPSPSTSMLMPRTFMWKGGASLIELLMDWQDFFMVINFFSAIATVAQIFKSMHGENVPKIISYMRGHPFPSLDFKSISLGEN